MSLLQDFDKVDINDALSGLGFYYDINENSFIHRIAVIHKLNFTVDTISTRLKYADNNLHVSIICKRPIKTPVFNTNEKFIYNSLKRDNDYNEHIKFENIIDADELMLIIEGLKKKVLDIYSCVRGDHIKIQNYKAELYKWNLK